MAEQLASFHAFLRDSRMAAGLTQEELAERAGITGRNVRVLESGSTKPQRANAQRLAQALGLEGERLEQFLELAARAPRRGATATE